MAKQGLCPQSICIFQQINLWMPPCWPLQQTKHDQCLPVDRMQLIALQGVLQLAKCDIVPFQVPFQRPKHNNGPSTVPFQQIKQVPSLMHKVYVTLVILCTVVHCTTVPSAWGVQRGNREEIWITDEHVNGCRLIAQNCMITTPRVLKLQTSTSNSKRPADLQMQRDDKILVLFWIQGCCVTLYIIYNQCAAILLLKHMVLQNIVQKQP